MLTTIQATVKTLGQSRVKTVRVFKTNCPAGFHESGNHEKKPCHKIPFLKGVVFA